MRCLFVFLLSFFSLENHIKCYWYKNPSKCAGQGTVHYYKWSVKEKSSYVLVYCKHVQEHACTWPVTKAIQVKHCANVLIFFSSKVELCCHVYCHLHTISFSYVLWFVKYNMVELLRKMWWEISAYFDNFFFISEILKKFYIEKYRNIFLQI